MANVKPKRTTHRVLTRRKTIEQPLRRCKTCLLVADELPTGFVCRLTRCPRKFQIVRTLNGKPLS